MSNQLISLPDDQSSYRVILTEEMKDQLFNSKTPITLTLNRSSNQNFYNQPTINLQIVFATNGTQTPKTQRNWAKAMAGAQSALDRYQGERMKLEVLIYEVFAAIIPQSRGGQPSWKREQMERERDAQKVLVDQLKQEYDNKLQKLDELIECCMLENNTVISKRLIKKKLSLLNQELKNRKERDKKLDSEIERALKPVKQGGFYSEHRKRLEYIQVLVKQDIERLERLIVETH